MTRSRKRPGGKAITIKGDRISPNLLILLFFLSGGSGLIYEVLWLRSFTGVFGITVYATSVVLSAFMGGLALGSYLFGRYMEGRGSPLRVYAYLEIGIGAYALLIPPIMGWLTHLYEAAYHTWEGNFASILLVRSGTSFLVLLAPTTMMGATLPVLSKFFAGDYSRAGREGGRLYAFNTFGAVAGTVLSGFLLIDLLGVSGTNYLAASLNVAIGLTVLWLGNRIGEPGSAPAPVPKKKGRAVRGKDPLKAAKPPSAPLVLILIGISGFSALSYEVIWTRIISMITFNTVYAFTTMLAVFLVGIALGSYLFSKMVDKERNLWSWFGAIQLGIGSYALAAIPMFGALARYYYRYQADAVKIDVSQEAFILKQFLLAGAIMIAPTILMGASFPLACKIYTLATKKVASGVGEVYAGNTLGAIAGSSLSGLLFIPTMGLKGGLVAAALLNMAAAVISFRAGSPSKGRGARRAAATVPVALGLLLLSSYTDVTFRSQVEVEGKRIIFHDEDAAGIVEVFQSDGSRVLVTNRLHAEGSDIPSEIYKQRKQGYLPLLLHPNPESVIEIGLGTGIGFAPVIYDRVKEAEMVEISQGVIKAAQLFSEANAKILEKPKVKLFAGDGRNHILLTRKDYDLIVMGLFTPYRSGVGYLYSLENFMECRGKLKDGGMVFMWLSLSQLSLEDLKIVLKTFNQVFPHVYLWDKGYYLAVLGMGEELRIDFQRFKSAFSDDSIRGDLEEWGLADPYNFLSSFLMGPEGVKGFTDNAPLNTEDRLRIEFSDVKAFKAAYSLEYASRNLSALLGRRKPPFDHIDNMNEAERLELERYFKARGLSLQALVYEGEGLYERAYEYFTEAEDTNYKDDIVRYSLKKYRETAE